MAERAARCAQRAADERHTFPDPRYRWRRAERGGDGARLPDSDTGRCDGQAETVGVDAEDARLEGAELRTGQRRFDRVPESFGGRGTARDVDQGSLRALLGVQQPAGAAV